MYGCIYGFKAGYCCTTSPGSSKILKVSAPGGLTTPVPDEGGPDGENSRASLWRTWKVNFCPVGRVAVVILLTPATLSRFSHRSSIVRKFWLLQRSPFDLIIMVAAFSAPAPLPK